MELMEQANSELGTRNSELRSLARRLALYQQERFPLARYAPLVAVFTFSATAYSRLLRGAPGYIPPSLFVAGVFTTLVLFFLLRVLDEHKDAATDRLYRPELPVPRGLTSLGELRAAGAAALAIAVALNALLAPRLLWALGIFALAVALMTKEFFAGPWLRRHVTAYLLTHMTIMPVVDAYTTGLDWLAAGAAPRAGLGFFLAVTFLNGVVLEVGRKIRAPGDERKGVDTYSAAWGVRAAPRIWIGVLIGTAATAWLAARAAGAGQVTAILLIGMWLLAARAARPFLRAPSRAEAQRIENAGGLWTLSMYLLLGAGPFVARWVGR
jgi:4-hydroxybenzoate polyprenyltransferase